jgi:ABC-type bacteriocin/lantibiotic exporter with double-glycine peptidase domain
MQQNKLTPFLHYITELLKLEVDQHELNEHLQSYNKKEILSVLDLYEIINKQSAVSKLMFNLVFLPEAEARTLIEKPHFPIITFGKSKDLTPQLHYTDATRKEKRIACCTFENDSISVSSAKSMLDVASLSELHQSGILGAVDIERYSPDSIPVISIVVAEAMVSTHDESANEELTPLRRVYKILNNEKRDIGLIYFYAVMMGVVSLALPLGIQAIIGLISGGLFLNSVIVLILIVVVATFIAGWIQVLQLTVVEKLQQRLFTKAAFEFAYRIPRIKAESLDKQYAPELMNRFFDVLTIQKALPKILIDFSTAGIQILFGLIMLSLYHPLFIIFGIVIIVVIAIIFYFTTPKALESNIKSSKYKYKTAYWIEELARTLHSFKLTGQFGFPITKMDTLLDGYLVNRQKHFGILVKQFRAIIAFKVFITAGLLIIGGVLVVERQINLGQFVASEIIILLVIASVEKLISTLENVYDLLTAVDKVGQVTDLPLERENGLEFQDLVTDRAVHISINQLNYSFDDKKSVLHSIDLDLKPFESLCISGPNGSGKSTLGRILAGLYENYEGSFIVNGLPLREINLNSFRSKVTDNLIEQDLFEGSIEQNISMGELGVSIKDVLEAIEIVGARPYVQSLPQGIRSKIEAAGKTLPSSIRQKLILARAIVSKPYVVIIDEMILTLDTHDRMKIISYMLDKKRNWNLILITNNIELMSKCDKVMLMDEGRVHAHGQFKDLAQNPLLSKL